jgi:hypothetical protein
VRRPISNFPKQELANAVELVKAIASDGKDSMPWDVLAPNLGHINTDGGAFGKRNQTAKAFGLITYSGGLSTLTSAGKRLVDSGFDQPALIEAFQNVELFRRVFGQFHDAIPPASEIALEMRRHGVAAELMGKAANVFIRSAKFAGLINDAGHIVAGKPREILGLVPITPLKHPSLPDSGISAFISPMGEPKMPSQEEDVQDVYPALFGIIKRLPPPGTNIGPKRRKGIIEAFASQVNFLYPEEEETP